MSSPTSLPARAWLLIPVAAFAFLIWNSSLWLRRVNYVTGIAQEVGVTSSASSTGYAAGTRELIVPEHVEPSYGWIVQTQQMLRTGQWRIRHIDYENAPYGRAEHASSPYRWWLGLLAWLDHTMTGQPLGLAVERAALVADPLLQLLFLASATVVIARTFGALSAAVFSVGGVTLFPFAAGFLPGAPDELGLAVVVALSGVLPLLAGLRTLYFPVVGGGSKTAVRDPAGAERRARRWFFLAGVIGGIGLWVNVANQAPILLGLAFGALLAAWFARVGPKALTASGLPLAPWRDWALGGGIAVLVAYLVEYSPADLGTLQLRVVHPLYGLAWLGCGEILVRVGAWLQRSKPVWSFRDTLWVALAAVLVAALPVAMVWAQNPGIFAADLLSFRLTKQPDGVMSPDLFAWVSQAAWTAPVWATLLPFCLIGPAVWLATRRVTSAADRASLAVVLGPVLVGLGWAYFHVRSFQLADGCLLLLVAVTGSVLGVAGSPALRRWLWVGLVVALLVPGVFQLRPVGGGAEKNVLTLPEVEGLIERDLAHWLARRVGPDGGAVVLAPPSLSSALNFYGGLRGLGSFSWENKDGLSVALRIVISNSPEEAHALALKRGITHVIVPSWDAFFEQYTTGASIQNGELFLTGLHRWAVPLWLRPIPYQLPTIGGFEGHSVTVFEVVDEQDSALALSRTTEYFVEMGQLESAKPAGQALRRFPADFGALVARAQLEAASGDTAALAGTIELLTKRLSSGGDRGLPWDRRASLAVVLARGKRMDLARVQVQRCLLEGDETRFRSLTTYSLFHLLGLSKAFGLAIPDPRLRDLAKDLLPSDLSRQF